MLNPPRPSTSLNPTTFVRKRIGEDAFTPAVSYDEQKSGATAGTVVSV